MNSNAVAELNVFDFLEFCHLQPIKTEVLGINQERQMTLFPPAG